jgi:hypothetical protein
MSSGHEGLAAAQQAAIRDLRIAYKLLVSSRHFARGRKLGGKSSSEKNDMVLSYIMSEDA